MPKSGHFMVPSLVALLAFLALISGAAAAFAVVADNHSSGFTRYARVDRPDGTYRNMLVDNASLEALRRGGPAETMTILMESFSDDDLTTVFVKRRKEGRWTYGSIRPGEGLDAFRPSPPCATCHRAAGASDGTFTRPMLEGFVKTGAEQQTYCDRPGRSPCSPDVYRRTSR
ncbi:hypothetical protein [Neorhizobium sp. DT-125]|uniref:hypothetical protein n=1 Tax=Neorhizobium sp. DT-125 TaxID=3396163 RepID=UPI003F1CFB44